MNLSNLADIADILAALGVIASLIFVGLQVRRSTLEARVNNHQAVAQRGIEWAEHISANDQVAEIYNKGLDNYKQLTQIERIRFNMIMMSLLIIIELSIFQLRHGMQELVEGDPPNKFLHRLTSRPGFVTWWQTDRQIDLGGELIAYMDKLIAN